MPPSFLPPLLVRLLPLMALIALTLIWGFSWVVTKLGLIYTSPFAFTAHRSIGGALALLIVVRLMGRSLRLKAPGTTFAIGLLQAGFMVLQTWAMVEAGAGKTAVLVFTMPIWTLLMAWPILGERIYGSQWLAAICTFTGLLLIIAPWQPHVSLFSEFLSIASALCWAAGTILTKRLQTTKTVDSLVLVTWQFIVAAVVMPPLSWLVTESDTNWTLSYVAIVLYMSLITMAIAWWLWLYILDRVPAWEASLSVLGIPVVAILSSRLIFGEEFKAAEIGGIVLIGTGLSLLSFIGWLNTRRIQASLGTK